MSLLFSVALYNFATREFDRGSQRQEEIVNRLPPPGLIYPNFQRRLLESRETVVREAKERILGQLIITNIVVFILGGGLSYLLARKTLEPIEEAHKALEQFTADASHELRTPIAAMKSEIEVALLQPKLKTGEAKGLLHSNLEELDRLTLLTDGLLSIARHEEKPLEVKNQELLLPITAAVSQLGNVAKEKEITIDLDVDSQIKASFDRHSLQEVMIILLDNAIKYSPNGSKVELRARTKKDAVIISVLDYGIGIKAEDLEHVFKRFYRADSSRAQTTKGHGLGLSIAKQLIERQNGTIHITSKPNEPTAAVISVPV
ncbi:MAG: HAMP domain-containing sensor histidine kinase [Candidatus Saccharimonadales bacterium]